MGATYSSIAVLSDDSDKVFELVRTNSKTAAWVSPPSKGFVCVFNSNIEDSTLAQILSKRMNCSALYALAAQEEVFRYQAFVKGKMIDRFDSCPDYPHAQEPVVFGNAAQLCKAFESKKVERIKSIVSTKFLFPSEQLFRLVTSLGMPEWMVGSYNYLGELKRDHPNVYKLGCHFNPLVEKESTQTDGAEERLAIIYRTDVQKVRGGWELNFKEVSENEPESQTLALGETFSRAVQVVNRGTQKRGVDLTIAGTAIESGVIEPRVKITGAKIKLKRTESGTFFYSLPQKPIAGWFGCEFSLQAMNRGSGVVRITIAAHNSDVCKPAVWVLDFTVA